MCLNSDFFPSYSTILPGLTILIQHTSRSSRTTELLQYPHVCPQNPTLILCPNFTFWVTQDGDLISTCLLLSLLGNLYLSEKTSLNPSPLIITGQRESAVLSVAQSLFRVILITPEDRQFSSSFCGRRNCGSERLSHEKQLRLKLTTVLVQKLSCYTRQTLSDLSFQKCG